MKNNPKSPTRLGDEPKNILALCRVAPAIPWPCFLAGEPPTSPAFPMQAGAPTTLHWLGKISVDDMADWLGRAPLYVLPAKYEPFGLSIVEAGLAGCALVLGDIPSLREIWDEAAVFVHPEDDQALEQHLYMLIKNHALRAMWSDRARRRAHQFSVAGMTSQYRILYEQLVHQSTGERESMSCES